MLLLLLFLFTSYSNFLNHFSALSLGNIKFGILNYTDFKYFLMDANKRGGEEGGRGV